MGDPKGSSGHAHSVFSNTVGSDLLTDLGPDGVTHRCTQPIRCVQPTLFMQGLVNSLRMFPGPHVLTAWSRLTSGGSPLTGGDGLTLYARTVVENPAPRGTNPIMAMGPAEGQYSPSPLPGNVLCSLEEGCGVVPHIGS